MIGRKSLKELRFYVYIHALAHIDWSYHELLYLDSLQTNFRGKPVPGCGRGGRRSLPPHDFPCLLGNSVGPNLFATTYFYIWVPLFGMEFSLVFNEIMARQKYLNVRPNSILFGLYYL